VTDVAGDAVSWLPLIEQPAPGAQATVTDTRAPDVNRGRVMVIVPTYRVGGCQELFTTVRRGAGAIRGSACAWVVGVGPGVALGVTGRSVGVAGLASPRRSFALGEDAAGALADGVGPDAIGPRDVCIGVGEAVSAGSVAIALDVASTRVSTELAGAAVGAGMSEVAPTASAVAAAGRSSVPMIPTTVQAVSVAAAETRSVRGFRCMGGPWLARSSD